jgi:toxin ParE1/3/4
VSWPVVYDRSVQADLNEIMAWYIERGSHLPSWFDLSFDCAVRAIADRPFSFSISFEGLRRAQLDRFPHGIYFRVLEHAVQIVAVVHPSRSSKVLKGRGT